MKHRVTNIKITATIISEDAGGVKSKAEIKDYPTNIGHLSPRLRELLIESTLPAVVDGELDNDLWGV